MVGQFLTALFFVSIFAKGYEGKGVMEGVRYGVLVGFLFVAGYFTQYAVYPITSEILWAWCGTGLAQSIGGGVVVSLVYKK
jgi:hypothetical protein